MKLTQTQRVEQAGLRAGERGICSVDFLLPDVIDGGKPITRLAARIKDSRDQGARWTVTGERHGCAVYVLDPASLNREPETSEHLACQATREPARSETAGPSVPDTPSPPGHGADEASTIQPALFDAPRRELSFDELFPVPRNAVNDDLDAAA